MSVYEEHTEALKEWHEACHDFQRAQERKGTARQRIEECTKKLHSHMETSLRDPTGTARQRIEECTKKLHSHMETSLGDPTSPNAQERSYINNRG